MNKSRVAIKVDVDTDGGTRDGALPLARICQRYKVPALFLFSLGPDNMGRSIRRIFQPGFVKKIFRTRVLAHYNLRTLLYGTVLPAPHLGRKYGSVMREVRDLGFEVGIHSYDHYRWQNHLHRFSFEDTQVEFAKAVEVFDEVFGTQPSVAGAAGWQANANSFAVYDEYGLLYASDTRGQSPFRPRVNGKTFRTPQFPTTLPTLDELIGLSEYPAAKLPEAYLEWIRKPGDHVLTVHAELEGMDYAGSFEALVKLALESGIEFYALGKAAEEASERGVETIPACELKQATIAGRSGLLAVQAA